MTNNLLFELFEIKQKFLREIPHPKLIMKQIKQIEYKSNSIVKIDFGYELIALGEADMDLTLSDFLEEYIEVSLGLKYKISAATNYSELHAVLVELYIHQIKLLKKLKSYLPQITGYPDTHIKQSLPFDTYLLLKSIHAKNLKENEIKNYLCTLLNASADSSETLLEACLRANKIISNG